MAARPRGIALLLAMCGTILAAAVPGAEAQGSPFYDMQVAPAPARGVITKSLGEVEFGFQVSFKYTDNPTAGQTSINVTVEAVTTVYAEGWQVVGPSERQFVMKPNENRRVTVVARLLSDRPAEDAITIQLRFTSQPFIANPSPLPIPGITPPPQLGQSDSETRSVEAEKRLTTSEVVTGLFRDYALWFGGLALVLLIFGVLLYRRRAPSTARVAVHCDEPEQQVLPGRGASFPVRITNDSEEREDLELEVEGVPPGWTAILPLKTFDLSAGASTQVWLTLKVPDSASAGERISIDLTARPEREPDRKARISLVAEVAGGEAEEAADVEAEPDLGESSEEETAPPPRARRAKRPGRRSR